MTTEQDIQEVELTIKQAEKHQKDKQALLRLMSNPDFNLVITQGYFEDESVRLVHAMSEPRFSSTEGQILLTRQMQGIAEFRDYLRNIRLLGDQMDAAINEHTQALNDLNMQEGS